MTNMGTRVERALCRAFDDAGWMVMRSPSSGAATTRDQPDVLVGNGEHVLAIEAKYSSGERIYLDPESDVEQLLAFGAGFGARPLFATRWKGDRRVYWFTPDDLDAPTERRTNYRARRVDAEAVGPDLTRYGITTAPTGRVA